MTSEAIAPQAQPGAEPVAWIRPSGKAMLDAGGYCTVYASDGMSNHSVPLFAAPPAQPLVEPVAWRGRLLGEDAWTLYVIDPTGGQGVDVVEPLFTAPQAQQPQLLTDEELADIAMHSGAYDEQLLAFARAIEQASLRKNGVVE